MDAWFDLKMFHHPEQCKVLRSSYVYLHSLSSTYLVHFKFLLFRREENNYFFTHFIVRRSVAGTDSRCVVVPILIEYNMNQQWTTQSQINFIERTHRWRTHIRRLMFCQTTINHIFSFAFHTLPLPTTIHCSGIERRTNALSRACWLTEYDGSLLRTVLSFSIWFEVNSCHHHRKEKHSAQSERQRIFEPFSNGSRGKEKHILTKRNIDAFVRTCICGCMCTHVTLSPYLSLLHHLSNFISCLYGIYCDRLYFLMYKLINITWHRLMTQTQTQRIE